MADVKNRRRLSEFTGPANGQGIEGAFRAALDATDEGGIIIFDAIKFQENSSFEYAVYSPLIVNKSVSIVGDTPEVKIVNHTRNGPIFSVLPNKEFFFLNFQNLQLVSGTVAISISGSKILAPNSKIENLIFKHQISRSIDVETSELNLHIENVWISGNVQYGIYLKSDSSHDNFSLEKSKIEKSSIAAIYFAKPSLGNGPIYISNTEINDSQQAIVVDNVRYYEHNVEYNANNANYVLSGTSIRITGSGGGGGGGGVTDHGALTGLSDDDHIQYLRTNGSRPMSGSLDMGGFSIINVVNVDGINLETLDSTVDSHILDTNNPHATSIANIDPGTLSQLNSKISDDNVVGESVFHPFTSSYLAFSASGISNSASFRSELNSQTASIVRLDNASGTFRGELNFQTASIVRLDNASGTFRTQLNSQTASITRLDNASASFVQVNNLLLSFSSSHASRHLSGGADPIDAQSLRGTGLSKDRVLISDGFGGWTTVLSSTFGGGGGGAHASSHHSGGVDSLDIQYLRADSVPVNYVFITHTSGGVTAVPSGSLGFVVNSDLQPFSASITSSIVRLDSASASFRNELNSQTTSIVRLDNASGTFRSELNSQTASIVRLDSASGTFEIELNALTSTVVRLDNASGVFRNELNFQTASITRLDNASGTFAIISGTYIAMSSAYARTSASFIGMSASYDSLSRSFYPVSASYNTLSSTYYPISATVLLHSSRHLSGGADPIDAQNLRGNALGANLLLISNGLGGWTTVASTSVGAPPGAPGLHASTHHSGGTDPIDAQFLRANGVPANSFLLSHNSGGFVVLLTSSAGFVINSDLQPFSTSITSSVNRLLAASSTFRSELNSQTASITRLDNASGTFEIELNALTSTVVRLDNASGAFRSELNSQTASIIRLDNASGTFRNELNSQTASIVRLDSASGTFRSELNALTSTVVRLDNASGTFAIISGTYIAMSAAYARTSASFVGMSASYDSLSRSFYPVSASYNTLSSTYYPVSSSFNVVSSSFIGFSSSHASRHLSGGVDPIDAQSLRANGLGSNLLLITNGLGGWTTVASQSVGGSGGGLHASTHHSGGSDPVDAQFLRANGTSANQILLTHNSGGFIVASTSSLGFVINSDLQPFSTSITSSVVRLDSMSATFAIISGTYIAMSAAYARTSASFIGMSASYDSLSRSFYPVSASYNTLSSTYYPVSASFNVVSSSFIGLSSSHASRHLSGGADPIDAQSLRGNSLGANLLLISNGLGGWTTVASASVGTPPGAPGAHASSHLSGGSDQISAQNLAANGLGANLLLITNANGGWTTVASQSVGGVGGGGITNITSASNEGRTLISGVFGNVAYIKTIKSLTSSVDNIRLSDTSPILLSSSDDTIYIRRRASSRAQYFFDDFINAVVTAAGFGWTFAAGGTGGSIQIDNVDNTSNRASYMGPAVGLISMDTGTTAAGGAVLQMAANSFALRHMSASSIEWRLVVSGSTDTTTQVLRAQFGWLDTAATGSRRPTNGIYFEMTASNFGFWNIVASSGGVSTAYNTAVAINSASLLNYKIETLNFPPTSSFYINDVLVGSISSTMPYSLKPMGPMVKIAKEIGTTQRDVFIDWCEIFYESIRE